MARLALSLPAELGPESQSTPDSSVTGVEHRSMQAAADEGETDPDRPQIDRWLACWSG